MRVRALLAALVLGATSALAVEPDEILQDPALEARARLLSQELRCVVCRNESIDESNARLARDLRLFLRERLVAGDSDQEAVDAIVSRYGEYVLLRPTIRGSNWVLWASGPVMLLLAFAVAGRTLRKPRPKAEALTSQEETRLKSLLNDEPPSDTNR